MILGLIGSHRTGKTTLAEAYAEKTGATIVKMDVGGLQRKLGFDSSNQSYDFDTRMDIQERLLFCFEEIYKSVSGEDAVVDRTPLDLIGYTMLAVKDDLSEAQSDRLNKYVQDCINLTNEHFTALVLVQPGIPLTTAVTSAKSCTALMEKLNLIYLGTITDERTVTPHFYIPRAMIKLEHRVKACELAMKKATERLRLTKRPVPMTLGGVEFSTVTRQ